jgi:hypothetical protein
MALITMADFHLWSKETLVRFAADATEKLNLRDAQIAKLEDDLRMMHRSWQDVIRRIVAMEKKGGP